MKYKDFVKRLQEAMNGAGETLTVDGDFGPKTLSALQNFDVQFILNPLYSRNTKDKWDLRPAANIIKEFEGLYLSAYLDPIGIPTIGWGTIVYPNGEKVKMGDTITANEAEEYLLYAMLAFAKSVDKLVKVNISNNAFCALVSFCYNLGAGALEKSTLLKRLNAGEPKENVSTEFMKWVNAGGKPLKGLVRRREAEKALFLRA